MKNWQIVSLRWMKYLKKTQKGVGEVSEIAEEMCNERALLEKGKLPVLLF